MQTTVPSYLLRDTRWMQEALKEAKKAADLGEIPVGAVIVRGETVIARAVSWTVTRWRTLNVCVSVRLVKR